MEVNISIFGIVFLTVLSALCIFELIKLVINHITEQTPDTPQAHITTKGTSTLYELQVIFNDGTDRTCTINSFDIAVQLLTYYNLLTDVHSTMLIDTSTNKVITNEVINNQLQGSA